MAILTFPGIIANKMEWSLRSNTQTFVSPLSRTSQTLELPGSHWTTTLRFNRLTEDDQRTMMAFLVRLRGEAGRFYLYDHSLPTPRGIATGTPLVDGASQIGNTLNTKDWTVGQTGIMKAGDWFTVNNELKMMTEDVNSDGSGLATLTFEPPLRASPAADAPLTIGQAPAIMRLKDDGQTRWSQTPGTLASFTITTIESFT